MKRRLLIVAVLAVMSFAMLFTGKPAGAACQWEACGDTYRSCMNSWCNGDPDCEATCKKDYNDCICYNCGACQPGGLP